MAPGSARTAKVSVVALIGSLEVAGGAYNLLEGDVKYNTSSGEPVVEYQVTDGVGHLSVTSAGDSRIPLGEVENEWQLRLSQQLPLDVEISMGVGELDLDLRRVWLNSIDVELAVGEVKLNLARRWEQDVDVNVQCSIGEIVIRVPRGIGVQVEGHIFIGDEQMSGLERKGDLYVNQIHGQSPITLKIRVEVSIGEIQIIEVEEEPSGVSI